MKKLKFILFVNTLFIGLFALTYTSCRHESDFTKATKKMCFSTDIFPIIQANCTMSGCHDATAAAGIAFNGYDDVIKLVKPGDAYNSNLFKVLRDTWGTLMPPKPNHPLTEEQRTAIFIWISQGASNICDTLPTDPVFTNDTTCFNKDVLPAFVSNCTISNCHDATSATRGYVFTDYTTITSKGIIPGNATNSLVYQRISSSDAATRMPPLPHNPLTVEQITNIFNWINGGTKNTVCTIPCDTSLHTWDGTISNIISTNCAGCHSGANPAFGLNLTTYNEVKTVADMGLLVSVINHTNGMPQMPPSSPLSVCQIAQIQNWVKTLPPPKDTVIIPPVSDTVCFTNEVFPIFLSNCTMSNCHNAVSHTEGYNFTTYSKIISRGIIGGNATGSKVYQMMLGITQDIMPPLPHNPLTTDQKALVAKWINQGAKNTSCDVACDTTQFTWSATISKTISTSCLGCHSGANPSFGIDLSTYNGVKAVADNGLLVQVIYHLNSKPLMPPSSALIDCKKKQIKKWVDAGSLNTKK